MTFKSQQFKMKQKEKNMINGILNIYKEKGYTSHDVVARLRGIVGQKKIGHTGTLDPDAEGVLPVCLGRATKVCDFLTDKDKAYETVLLLGKTTDTQDITGTVLKENDPSEIDEQAARECIEQFIGEYDQIPPMYSALKVNGKKLYELAREGKVVERKSRKVQIYDIKIKEISLPRIRMEVHCSKGTYIRTLCHDIGERLGVGGCMESLLRTKVSQFILKDSIRLSEVEQAKGNGYFKDILLPLDEVFADFPKLIVKDQVASLAYNGNPFRAEQRKGQLFFVNDSGKVLDMNDLTVNRLTQNQYRVYDEQQRFIGIYQYQKQNKIFRIEKMFFDPDEKKMK